MLLDLLILALLILFNGLLAMSELAVVSSRRARLKALLRRRARGARAALDLLDRPGRFLSTIQIGITLVGVLAGAFGGATFSEPLAGHLERLGLGAGTARETAFALVVTAITYLSLIVGELVPKQIALRDPETIARLVAPAMKLLARLARPLVWLLDLSSALVLRIVQARSPTAPAVTDDEIRALITEAASAGVVEPEEREMIAGVMRLADRGVRAIMTPRQSVDWIDLDAAPERIRAALRASVHSRLVAARGSIDNHVGLVTAKRLVDSLLDGAALDVAAQVEEALVIPDSIDALDAMEKLRASRQHAALVVDEFGSFQGIVTTTDLLSAIAGEFHRDEATPAVQALLRREDGSWLVDGALGVDELAEHIGLHLPADRDYETAAGLVLNQLGRLPELGETTTLDGWQFEVVDLDGRRIDRLVVRRGDADDADGR